MFLDEQLLVDIRDLINSVRAGVWGGCGKRLKGHLMLRSHIVMWAINTVFSQAYCRAVVSEAWKGLPSERSAGQSLSKL